MGTGPTVVPGKRGHVSCGPASNSSRARGHSRPVFPRSDGTRRRSPRAAWGMAPREFDQSGLDQPSTIPSAWMPSPEPSDGRLGEPAHKRVCSPAAAQQLDTIAFEATDLAEARRSLDELPAGVAQLAKYEPNYWEQRRRRPTTEDRALTGVAIEWLLLLPPEVRPRALCERHPRLVNLLAAAWSCREERALLLQSLLTDTRGGRGGFPSNVLREIEALSRFAAQP
jgi:hypothetical protein